MTEWMVQVEDGRILGDLWGALNDPDPNPDPAASYLSKARVGQFAGFSVHIFSDEHPPPHFRVNYAGETADYTIRDCQQIRGGLRKHYRRIRAWHARNKEQLVIAWNELRPTDCPVGPFSEGAA